jgi:hypothetical protein
MVPLFQVSKPKPWIHLSYSPFVPHGLPILIRLVLITLQYFVRSTNCEYPHCAISSPLLLTVSPLVQIAFSETYPDTLSQSSCGNARDEVSHPYKTTAKSHFCYFNLPILNYHKRKPKVLNQMGDGFFQISSTFNFFMRDTLIW